MAKQSIIVQIDSGKISNPKPLKTLFSSLNGRYKIDISPLNKRSLSQNAYLHGILIPEFRNALNQVGYDEVKTDSQAKAIMKSMFLAAETVNKETGEIIKYIRNTRDLTKEEMCVLIDEVIRFAAENMNYQIAYPNEQLTMNY